VLGNFTEAVMLINIKYNSRYGDYEYEGEHYFTRIEVLKAVINTTAKFQGQQIAFGTFDAGLAVLLKNMQNVWPVFLFHNGLNFPGQPIRLIDSMFSAI